MLTMPGMASPQIDMAHLRAYWNKVSSQRHETEQSSIQLTNELINRVEELAQLLETEQLDRAREQATNRELQKKNIKLQSEANISSRILERDTSVLVLIDGDGLLFQDKFVREGESGGQEAAQELYSQISQHIDQFRLPPDVKVLVRVYANTTGLARTYADAGIADFSTASAFTKGFTKARAHFDFVDCGSGKERADRKISASFNLYVNNYQTRHIILGVSHDNGYARLLEELSDDAHEKITLLEGVPFARELNRIKHQFHEAKFPELFRDAKIDLSTRSASEGSPNAPFAFLTNGSGNSFRSYSPERSSSSTGVVADHGLSRSPHRPSPVSALDATAAAGSWADRASTATPPGFTLVQHSTNHNASNNTKQVRRNRKGQRLDPTKPAALDRETIDRIQKMKLCNNKNLKGECRLGSGLCEHNHTYKPSRLEMEALRYIARRIPCVNETACDDASCTAGHRCPWISEGSCYYQNRGTCKFSKEMHYADLKEVKTTVVR